MGFVVVMTGTMAIVALCGDIITGHCHRFSSRSRQYECPSVHHQTRGDGGGRSQWSVVVVHWRPGEQVYVVHSQSKLASMP